MARAEKEEALKYVSVMGRPRKEIEADKFENLCGLQCTLIEIASFFYCSPDTIERWCKRTYGSTFADAYKVFSASGKISLRRLQFKHAEKNPGMAIFLGKQMLEQSDGGQGMQDKAENNLAEAIKKGTAVLEGEEDEV